MGKHYGHVTIEERCEIARLHSLGHSVRQIAAGLDRSASTVARELKRNGSRTQGYQPRYADQQAHARRWRGSRLERDEGLRAKVLSGLKQGWSPEQVSGRMTMESGRTVISHESIYRFIYGQMARKKDYGWRHYLARGKSKRGFRGRRGGSPATFMAKRRPITERPQVADDRSTPGHWEADLMLFRTYGDAVLTHARTALPHSHSAETPWQVIGPHRLCHVAGAGSVSPRMEKDGDLRQRYRVCPPLPTPRVGYRDLLLRYVLSLAEGWSGERYRPAAS